MSRLSTRGWAWRASRAGLVALLVTHGASCVDTSADRVRLSAEIVDPEIAVEEQTLVTVLSGSFDMRIEVGDLAGEQSTIDEPPSLQLVVASDRRLVRALDAVPEGETFPITIDEGDSIDLRFTLTDENLLAAEQKADVCASGELQIVGSLRDSLSGGRSASFSSGEFLPTGC